MISILFERTTMKKRTLLLTLAAAVLVWGFGALEARAAQVLLPAPLSTLTTIPPSTVNFAIVPAPSEGPQGYRFDSFTYSTSPVNSPPTAANITVSEFHLGSQIDGITLSGAFAAAAGQVIDYAVSYVVTDLVPGHFFTDAHLSGVFSVFGGTGSVAVSETLHDAISGALLGTLDISTPPGSASDSLVWATSLHPTSILVQKDIILTGGTAGASISIINQGFSSTVPEPASMSLLGIGMAGFFAFRRFFKKRTTVA